MNVKKSMQYMLVIYLSLLIGCSPVDTSESILTKVQGDGFTYSGLFKGVDELDNRKNGTYYKPVSMAEMMTAIPDTMRNAIHLIDSKKIPFDVDEEAAYLVTSQDDQGNVQHQVQFSYSSGSLSDKFLIISVTEVEENPLTKHDFSTEKYDPLGNELRKEVLVDDIPIFHQVVTTNSGLVYRYYNLNEEKNIIHLVNTRAHELYAYYQGHVYHVGYAINESQAADDVHEQFLHITREWILGANE